MRLALVIRRYFPHGGLQRDFLCILRELVARGHDCRVYCAAWEGDAVGGVELRRLPVRGLANHTRCARFARRVLADLAADPVDAVVGFNPMPGLDVLFAGDLCYAGRARRERGALYRRSPRYRYFAGAERACFDPASATRLLLLSERQLETYRAHYATPTARLHLLPPGICPDRLAAPAAGRRAAVREALGLERGELALLFVGGDFHNKGLDRAITALAHMAAEQPATVARLLVAGAGRPRRARHLARRLGVEDRVVFLGGRDDVPDLMRAADLLVHPARVEAAGAVLLEAVAAGLPVVATDACGHAACVAAARAGILLPEPFEQALLDRAVMRNIDGVFRADCRETALRWAAKTDLRVMHRAAAECIEQASPRRGGPGPAAAGG